MRRDLVQSFYAAFLVGLWLVHPAAAADHLVATPAEFAAAATRLAPGDRLVLRNGVWENCDLELTAAGTPEQAITVAAETPGGVTVRGKSRLAIGGKHVVVTGLVFQQAWHPDAVLSLRAGSERLAADCRVTECAWIDCNPPDAGAEGKYVSIYGQRNRLDHCRLEGKRSRGTTLVVWLAEGPAGHQIDHNLFGPRPELKKNGGETIRVGDSKTALTPARVTVEWNVFEECNGEAEIISNKSCENVYRYNAFYRCAGALTLRHGRKCRVEGNWFFGAGAAKTGGIRVIGPDHTVLNNYLHGLTGDGPRSALSLMAGVPESPANGYEQTARAKVLFNSVLACKHPLVIGLQDKDADTRLPPSDCLIAGNLITGEGENQLVESPVAGERTTWRHNAFHQGTVSDAEAKASSLSGDPLLAQAAGDPLWRPGAESPVRKQSSGERIAEDIDGQPRRDPTDIGCDTASTEPITRKPLKPQDVGPAWREAPAKGQK